MYTLAPRGPHASRTREGNTRRQNSHHSLRSRPFSYATGRPAPPLRPGCLIRINVASRKRLGSSILNIYRYAARAFLRERILALKGEGITWMGQPSRLGIALFSVRTEFWRSTAFGFYHYSLSVHGNGMVEFCGSVQRSCAPQL